MLVSHPFSSFPTQINKYLREKVNLKSRITVNMLLSFDPATTLSIYTNMLNTVPTQKPSRKMFIIVLFTKCEIVKIFYKSVNKL